MKTKKLPWVSSEEMERHGFTLDTDIDSAPQFDDEKESKASPKGKPRNAPA